MVGQYFPSEALKNAAIDMLLLVPKYEPALDQPISNPVIGSIMKSPPICSIFGLQNRGANRAPL